MAEQSNSQSSIAKQLANMADILFLPMLFYILTQWDKIHHWQGKILWGALFIIVQNELFSVRESYKDYNVLLYFLDLSSLLFVLFAISSLSESKSPLGYDPEFWFFIAALWLVYSLWDFVMAFKTPDGDFKRDLKRWGRWMLLFSALTVLCAFGIITNESNTSSDGKLLIFIIQIIPFAIILWVVFQWIHDMQGRFLTLGHPPE